MSEITRSPLCWPNNVARTLPFQRGNPHFAQRTIAYAAREILGEINRLNKRRHDYEDASVIISTNLLLNRDGSPRSNQQQPTDTGAAVYFKLIILDNGKKFERPIVLSCDRWRRVEDNLLAIAKDIEAQRARERWGCTNMRQAFQGYLAIPEKCGGKSWWDLLGLKPEATEGEIDKRFKSLAMSKHPDKGGNRAEWDELQQAHDQAMARFRKATE